MTADAGARARAALGDIESQLDRARAELCALTEAAGRADPTDLAGLAVRRAQVTALIEVLDAAAEARRRDVQRAEAVAQSAQVASLREQLDAVLEQRRSIRSEAEAIAADLAPRVRDLVERDVAAMTEAAAIGKALAMLGQPAVLTPDDLTSKVGEQVKGQTARAIGAACAAIAGAAARFGAARQARVAELLAAVGR